MLHPTNGQVRWNVPDKEYLDVEITKAHRGGLTVDNPPGSKAELDAAFEAKRQKAVTASRRPPHDEYSAARSHQQQREQSMVPKTGETRATAKKEEMGEAKARGVDSSSSQTKFR